MSSTTSLHLRTTEITGLLDNNKTGSVQSQDLSDNPPTLKAKKHESSTPPARISSNGQQLDENHNPSDTFKPASKVSKFFKVARRAVVGALTGAVVGAIAGAAIGAFAGAGIGAIPGALVFGLMGAVGGGVAWPLISDIMEDIKKEKAEKAEYANPYPTGYVTLLAGGPAKDLPFKYYHTVVTNMLNHLKNLNTKNESTNQTILPEIKKMTEIVSYTAGIARRFDEISNKCPAYDSQNDLGKSRTLYNELAKDVAQHLRQKERTLIPMSCGNHMMMIEFVKNPTTQVNQQEPTYTIKIYNSGAGLNIYHKHRKDIAENKYETVYQVTDVPVSQLQTEDIAQLMEFRQLGGKGDNFHICYGWANHRGIRIDNDIDCIAQATQKSGDCRSESMMAFLRNNMSEEAYKYTKSELLKGALLSPAGQKLGTEKKQRLTEKAQSAQRRYESARKLRDKIEEFNRHPWFIPGRPTSLSIPEGTFAIHQSPGYKGNLILTQNVHGLMTSEDITYDPAPVQPNTHVFKLGRANQSVSFPSLEKLVDGLTAGNNLKPYSPIHE